MRYSAPCFFLLTIFFMAGCSKPAPLAPPINDLWEDTVRAEVLDFLEPLSPAPVIAVIPGTQIASVTADSINVRLEAMCLMKADSTNYTGPVTYRLQAVRSMAGMLYSGITTVADNGQLLISEGMFRFEATDNNGQPLQLRPGCTYNARFPRISNPETEVFKGKPSQDNNKVTWERWDSTGIDGNVAFGFGELFKWANLDRYMNESPLTNLTVYLPAGFSSTNTVCFLRYINEQSSAFVPANATLRAFSTVGSHYKVVQGRSASVICVAKKDGLLYAQVVAIPEILENQVVNIAEMKVYTENNLKQTIGNF